MRQTFRERLATKMPRLAKSEGGFTPPPAVRSAARRGLELRKKHNRGGTMVGVARARDLANGKALSASTIRRMNSYFARHAVDKKGKDWANQSNPSAGYIAWLLWGGDAGRSWASGRARSLEKTLLFIDLAKTLKYGHVGYVKHTKHGLIYVKPKGVKPVKPKVDKDLLRTTHSVLLSKVRGISPGDVLSYSDVHNNSKPLYFAGEVGMDPARFLITYLKRWTSSSTSTAACAFRGTLARLFGMDHGQLSLS